MLTNSGFNNHELDGETENEGISEVLVNHPLCTRLSLGKLILSDVKLIKFSEFLLVLGLFTHKYIIINSLFGVFLRSHNLEAFEDVAN
jgi:hypothetical protein